MLFIKPFKEAVYVTLVKSFASHNSFTFKKKWEIMQKGSICPLNLIFLTIWLGKKIYLNCLVFFYVFLIINTKWFIKLLLHIVYDLCFFRHSKTINIVIFGIEYRQFLSITIRDYQHQPQLWSTVTVEMISLKLNIYKLLTQWYQYIIYYRRKVNISIVMAS